jgi:hypothetical protein
VPEKLIAALRITGLDGKLKTAIDQLRNGSHDGEWSDENRNELPPSAVPVSIPDFDH